MTSTETSTDVQLGRRTGQIKWFNNNAGYGFITINSGENSNNDIFVHYSSILVKNSQYKYLIQGEYVEFNLVKSSTDKHEYQANDVSGINGGPLMCETRRNYQQLDNTDVQQKKQLFNKDRGTGTFQNRRNKGDSTGRSDSRAFTSNRRQPQSSAPIAERAGALA